MQTLIIHPDDRSTDFLRPIYTKLLDVTVITKNCTRDALLALIQVHDQIIILGHGSPDGLINVSHIGWEGYVIGDWNARFLKDKQLVAVWCHANLFMEKHKLSGLYSGMFISEVAEAMMYGIKTTQEEVDESNNVFSTTFGNVIPYTAQEEVFKKVKRTYTELAKTNIIAKYNSSRWYHAPSESTYQTIQNLERGYKMT